MPVYAQAIAVASAIVLAAIVVWLLAARYMLAADVDRFAGFMEHGPFVAFMKDADGRYVYENRALRDFVQRLKPDTTTMIGRTDHELFPAGIGDTYVHHDRTVIETGKPLRFDEVSVEADGTVRHWSSIKFPRRDERGHPCIAGISIDVTDLRQARTAARSSEDRCALALDAGRMGDFRLDLTTHMLDTSPLFASLHGRPETKTRLSLEESLAEVHPDDRSGIITTVQSALNDEAPNRMAYRIVAPDGSIRWVELVGRVFHDDFGRPTVVRGVGFDITEQRNAYDELAHRKTILRRLIDVQENERQTLCQELHDGLIQYAIGAKMQLESARDEADDQIRAERIDAALDCLDRGIAEGRAVIRGVRPAVLDDLGLTAAIDDLAEQLVAAGINVEKACDDGLDTIPPALQTTIYRVVQESLTNARKHAGVDRAEVQIRVVGDEVLLRVSDHGAGFDVDVARKHGFGLTGMTERVRLAGGSLRIDSRPGSGTTVTARLPTWSGTADRPHPSDTYAAAGPDVRAR